MGKYFNKKVEKDGMTFDSKKEYRRWQVLCALEEVGLISDLRRQVKFTLIPKQCEVIHEFSDDLGLYFVDGNVVEYECSYYADFVYYTKDGEKIVEDTKGLKTAEYIIKRKLMLLLYDIRIHEI